MKIKDTEYSNVIKQYNANIGKENIIWQGHMGGSGLIQNLTSILELN